MGLWFFVVVCLFVCLWEVTEINQWWKAVRKVKLFSNSLEKFIAPWKSHWIKPWSNLLVEPVVILCPLANSTDKLYDVVVSRQQFPLNSYVSMTLFKTAWLLWESALLLLLWTNLPQGLFPPASPWIGNECSQSWVLSLSLSSFYSLFKKSTLLELPKGPGAKTLHSQYLAQPNLKIRKQF